MLKKIIKKIIGTRDAPPPTNNNDYKFDLLQKDLDDIRQSLGHLHSKMSQRYSVDFKNIQQQEFKVYSQWGDDGIIQFLVNYLDIDDKRFVEFGVDTYKESNTRFLLINNNWTGLIMDGSETNINAIRNEEIYWKHNLTANAAFITAENINGLLSDSGFTGEIGLLHIDIDGNDYWVWKSINVVKPVIVIMEYNSIFGANQPWTVPYDASFMRTDKHYSNLYFGSSLLSICDLAKEKGYSFIGSNSNGNNAYFVRNDKLKQLEIKSTNEGYVFSEFSESRDENGSLTFLRKEKRLALLTGMEVYNTRTNLIEKI
jgi:hypothetical protein